MKFPPVIGLTICLAAAFALGACAPIPPTSPAVAPTTVPVAVTVEPPAPTAAPLPTATAEQSAPTAAPAATSAPVATAAAVPAAGSPQPPPAEVCNGMAQALSEALTRASTGHQTIEVTQSETNMTDPTTMATGTGCRAEATGTGEQFAGPDVVVNAITEVLTGGGWKEDMKLQAGGPMGMGTGYRSGEVMCQSAAMWRPAESANCPQDAPISACSLTPAQHLYTVTLDCAQPAK